MWLFAESFFLCRCSKGIAKLGEHKVDSERIEFGESEQERAVLSLKCKQMKQHDDCSKETFSPIIVKWKVDELVSTDKLATGERDFDSIFSIHRWSINVFQTREV